jgi:hypothetical protein
MKKGKYIYTPDCEKNPLEPRQEKETLPSSSLLDIPSLPNRVANSFRSISFYETSTLLKQLYQHILSNNGKLSLCV